MIKYKSCRLHVGVGMNVLIPQRIWKLTYMISYIYISNSHAQLLPARVMSIPFSKFETFIYVRTGWAVYLIRTHNQWTSILLEMHTPLEKLCNKHMPVSRVKKHLLDHINSLRGEALSHKTSLTRPFLLKCLYQDKKVSGHVFVC